MDRILAVAAIGEFVTGLALLASPQIVVRLLLSAEPSGSGLVVSRVAGIALIALGIACWPAAHASRTGDNAYGGMLVYSALTALCLALVGLADRPSGPLLWPATVFHAAMTGGLALAWSRRAARARAPSASMRP